jgi:hypothetical protein
MMSFACASFMRSAKASLEKPPKTTLCVAPMRAQGQHRDRRFGDQRHVDTDLIAGDDAQVLQDIGAAADFMVQLAVGERAPVARFAFPQQRRLVALARLQLPIETVVGQVWSCRPRTTWPTGVPTGTSVPGLEPVQRAGHFGPRNSSGDSTDRRYIASYSSRFPSRAWR